MNHQQKTSPCPRCRSNGKDSRGDNLVNYPNGHSHCFACGFHISPKHYVPPPKEINGKAGLPFDFTREVPAAAYKWLLQFGLPYSYWKDSTGYSPSEERLVFVYDNFSIGRYVGTDEVRKWRVWGDCHQRCVLYGEDISGPVVLVEDLVSAHKVGQVATSMCLFGTRLYPCHINWLIKQKRPIVFWLDKDQHYAIMRKSVALQALTGQPVRFVSTNKDPKELTLTQLKEQIENR